MADSPSLPQDVMSKLMELFGRDLGPEPEKPDMTAPKVVAPDLRPRRREPERPIPKLYDRRRFMRARAEEGIAEEQDAIKAEATGSPLSGGCAVERKKP